VGSAHSGDHYRTAVGRVIVAMGERPAVPLTLSEMAALSFMSPFHFTRVFRLVTGIPPGLFQSALRLEAAKKLLLTTALTLTEICDELGFLSSATFARQFKAKVGMAPERLRRLGRMIQESPLEIGDPLRMLQGLENPSPGLTGMVRAPEGFEGLVAVALFRKAAPEGWPIACALRLGTGTFVLPRLPEGTYHLLAAGLDRREDIASCLASAHLIPRSDARGLRVLVQGGKLEGLPDEGVRLRAADPLDPPILFAFPALLLEPLLGDQKALALFQRAG
jgi:AraC family transcriptional regulator